MKLNLHTVHFGSFHMEILNMFTSQCSRLVSCRSPRDNCNHTHPPTQRRCEGEPREQLSSCLHFCGGWCEGEMDRPQPKEWWVHSISRWSRQQGEYHDLLKEALHLLIPLVEYYLGLLQKLQQISDTVFAQRRFLKHMEILWFLMIYIDTWPDPWSRGSVQAFPHIIKNLYISFSWKYGDTKVLSCTVIREWTIDVTGAPLELKFHHQWG